MRAWVAGVMFGASIAAFAETTEITIQPGPSEMSEAEKAIVADPANGIQHGVILVEETERDDDYGMTSRTTFHLRAKVLSNEARSLGDIAIPVERGPQDLKKWWGRTICPDHTQELAEGALTTQVLEKTRWGKTQELRGALPGVGPGCVIDFGYVVQSEYVFDSERVFLQRDWPVRSFQYRWIPSRALPASYVLARAEGLPIKGTTDRKSVLVAATNLAPVPEEPQAPPKDESRASAVFYYTEHNEKVEEFWNSEAKAAEGRMKSFVSGNALRAVVQSLPVPADASTDDRLRAAYAWIGKNLKNTNMASAEEAEADTDKDDKKVAYNAAAVLKSGEATPRQLDYVFAGMARALGAEANLVYAVDRSDRFWLKPWKSMDQFAYTVVAVRMPGQSDDQLTFVDAGSELPYGEIPWRATGATALMCGPKGATNVLIPASSPKANRSDTHLTLAFSEDNQTLTAKWDTTASGAYGDDYRRWLRRLDPRKRKETLDRICGSSSTAEVTSAELPGLDEHGAAYKIVCNLEDSDISIDESTRSYSYRIAGPWSPQIPELTASSRTQAVLFDYPKVDVLSIDVGAPHGFKPKPPAAPVELKSPYGRYMLDVKATDAGFHVDRAFALIALVVKPEEYPALRKFLEDVHNADRTAVTFERAAGTP